MLIVTRKLRQVISVGDDVRVVVVEVRGSQARLRIEAPADVPWGDQLLAAIPPVDLVTTSPPVLAERIVAQAKRP